MHIRQTGTVWLWALIGVALAGLWQTLTVHGNFEGNWTALYCTSDQHPVPPELARGTYIFLNSGGYDGQWYRYVAHDPLLRSDLHTYIDAPPLRYRRILVPALASLLAAGQKSAIDATYIAVILAFVCAGCYWCGMWALRHGRYPAWGLLFLAVPGTLISLDRLTVDVALAALAAGAVVYWDAGKLLPCYLCLAAACLARETGVLLVGGWMAALALQKRWRALVAFTTAMLPAVAWFLYVRSSLPQAPREQSIPSWLFHWDSGIVGRLIDPVRYGFTEPLETAVRAMDSIALAGMIVALALTAVVLARQWHAAPALAAGMHLALFAIVNLKGFWDNVYGYARPFSAVIVLTALSLPVSGRLWLAMVVAASAMDLRVLVQLGPQALGIWRHWLG